MATLEQIVGMGFSEDAAKAALDTYGNGALDALLGITPAETSPQVGSRSRLHKRKVTYWMLFRYDFATSSSCSSYPCPS